MLHIEYMDYVTLPQRVDGFGAQFLNIYRALIFVEDANKSFLFMGIKSMISHSTDDSNRQYIDKIVDYMNIHQYYLTEADILNGSTIHCLPDVCTFYHMFCSRFEELHQSYSFMKYKKIFMSDKVNPYDTQFFNVAIHIRKEDKYLKQGEGRELPDFPDEYYTNFCKQIRAKYQGDKPLKFHIYSIGDESVFDYLKNEDVVLHINEDMLDTFTGFVFADILLISHSCLSYTAAFFNNGVIFYKYWNHLHPGLQTWKLYN